MTAKKSQAMRMMREARCYRTKRQKIKEILIRPIKIRHLKPTLMVKRQIGLLKSKTTKARTTRRSSRAYWKPNKRSSKNLRLKKRIHLKNSHLSKNSKCPRRVFPFCARLWGRPPLFFGTVFSRSIWFCSCDVPLYQYSSANHTSRGVGNQPQCTNQ